MPAPEQSIPEVYVQPGECRMVTVPVILRTVLGSCVGITFQVPRLQIGALCHPMLPQCPVQRMASMNAAAGRRYVDFAIREMARHLDSLGAARAETRVKLFGGADVLSIADAGSRPTVGKLNCEAAMRVLKEEGFTVSASSLGGCSGVHIQFQTATGEVLLRRLDTTGEGENPKSERKVHLGG
jgi:chemotaxis protein CheD